MQEGKRFSSLVTVAVINCKGAVMAWYLLFRLAFGVIQRLLDVK